jgi:hypothetical protein
MGEMLTLAEGYVVVIETDQYAGMFERQLCAYVTGVVGECEVGRDMSNLYYRDMDIEDDESSGKSADQQSIFYGFIGDKQDDDGTWRPCSIWPNPRYGVDADGKHALLDDDNFEQYNYPANLGVAIFFNVEPTPEQRKIVSERANKFFEITDYEANIERIRLLREIRGVDDLGDI